MSEEGKLSSEILALPARLAVGNTPYVGVLHRGLKQRGCTIRGWRSIGPPQAADILLVHWPEAVFWNRLSQLNESGARFAADRLLATCRRVRAAGGAVIWTIHDLRPHDGIAPSRRAIWEYFFAALLDRLDAVISLSRVGLREAQTLYPALRQTPSLVVPHPHFCDTLPVSPRPEQARVALGLPQTGTILCSVGQVRPYKGLLALIEAFAAADTGATLVIGGNCQDPALAEQLKAVADAAGASVRLELRVLTNEEVALIYAASDAAVFNFSSVLNSGSVMTALSFGKPVIAPARGALIEVAGMVGPAWMRLADMPTPDALRDAVAWVRRGPRDRRPDLSAFEPASIVGLHANFFRSILAERRHVQLSPAGVAAWHL